jgi:hypothetical protein
MDCDHSYIACYILTHCSFGHILTHETKIKPEPLWCVKMPTGYQIASHFIYIIATVLKFPLVIK